MRKLPPLDGITSSKENLKDIAIGSTAGVIAGVAIGAAMLGGNALVQQHEQAEWEQKHNKLTTQVNSVGYNLIDDMLDKDTQPQLGGIYGESADITWVNPDGEYVYVRISTRDKEFWKTVKDPGEQRDKETGLLLANPIDLSSVTTTSDSANILLGGIEKDPATYEVDMINVGSNDDHAVIFGTKETSLTVKHITKEGSSSLGDYIGSSDSAEEIAQAVDELKYQAQNILTGK